MHEIRPTQMTTRLDRLIESELSVWFDHRSLKVSVIIRGCPSPPRSNAQIPHQKSQHSPPIEKSLPTIMTQGVQAVPGSLGSMEYLQVKGENLKIKTSKLQF